MSTTVRSVQGDTLDDLVWQHYGRSAGAVEAVLEANPGLADLGPILPTGTSVTLPDLEPAAPESGRRLKLWD